MSIFGFPFSSKIFENNEILTFHFPKIMRVIQSFTKLQNAFYCHLNYCDFYGSRKKSQKVAHNYFILYAAHMLRIMFVNYVCVSLKMYIVSFAYAHHNLYMCMAYCRIYSIDRGSLVCTIGARQSSICFCSSYVLSTL